MFLRLSPCLLLVASLACSLDRGGLGGTDDGGVGNPDAALADGEIGDAGPGSDDCLTPSDCPAGLACVLRTCVDPTTDMDMDGVPADMDCDDGNPAIGTIGERGCSSACADGLERCTDGVWSACDAPVSCDCMAGETRDLSCPMCGTQRQVCGAAGTWENDGGCVSSGACLPGAMETTGSCGDCGMNQRTCLATCEWDTPSCVGEGVCAPGTVDAPELQRCGVCSSGSQSRTRTCNASCAWDAPGPWSACRGESGCMPGSTEMDTIACGNCGLEARTRTCSTSCAFDPWVPSGVCRGEGACAPGSVMMQSTSGCGMCMNGTITMTRICTRLCAWPSVWVTSGCMNDNFCTDNVGRTICPGSRGTTSFGCSGSDERQCTCDGRGNWTSCNSCD